jgi:hypothetical protein
LAHNQYQYIGGEDSVLQSEFDLLQNMGYEVKLAVKNNSEIKSLPDKLKTFINAPFAEDSQGWMLEAIKNNNPDIVHVHNFSPLLTPSI